MLRERWGRDAENMIETGAVPRDEGHVRDYDGSRPLRLVWSGLHIGRKALPVLLHALAIRFSPDAKGRYPASARLTIFLLTIVFYGFYQPAWLAPFLLTIGLDLFWASRLGRAKRRVARRLRSRLLLLPCWREGWRLPGPG